MDSTGGKSYGGGLSGANLQAEQTDENEQERIDAGRGHVSIQTVLRNEPETNAQKQEIEKARIIASFDKLFRGDPETLKRNRDELFVLGEKFWLGSRNARLQGNPLEAVANGIIGQFINIQPSNENNIFGLNEYPMLAEEVNHMNDVRDELVQKLSERLGDQEFSEERQKQLKKQALREFLHEGRSFVPGGWAEKGAYVFPEGQPGQHLSGAQVLQREGFVDNDDEWQGLRREAADAAIEHSRLTLHTVEQTGGRAPERVMTVNTPVGYRELFGLKFPLSLLATSNEANRQEVVKLIQEMPVYHDSVYNFVDYKDIVRGESWQEMMERATTRKMRSAGYAAAEAFPVHQIGAEEREALLSAVQSIAMNVELAPEDHDKRVELETLSTGFAEAFGQGVVHLDTDEVVMMRPWDWLSQNGETIEHLRQEAGATQEDNDADNVLSGLLPGRFTNRMVTRALGQILYEKDRAAADENQAVIAAAQAAISDYLSIVAGSANAREVLANLEKSQQYDPMLEECLPAELKPILMQEHVKDIANGVSGMDKLYFFDPLRYDSGFNLTRMAEKVPALSPNETLAQKEARLLEDSYLGLFEILLAEGKLGPKGIEIQQSHREDAANQYFKAFNYDEHLSNLNQWLDEKVNELKDAGDEQKAQKLLKRFKQWTQNPAVRKAFETYSKQSSEAQSQLEQAQRDTEAQIIEGVTIEEIQKILAEQMGLDFEDVDSRFQYGSIHPISRTREETDAESANYSMPLKVSEARIKMHAAWSQFIKDEFPDGDVEECMMIFHQQYDRGSREETIRECLRHLDGNTYMAIAFSDAKTGKRCMIAECLGASGRYAVSGAMKVWRGEITDQDGWKEVFRHFSKSEANAAGAIGSINHVNVTADVMKNWSEGDYVIPSIEDMYRLAMLYLETGDEKFLSNTIANRRYMEEHPFDHHWR